MSRKETTTKRRMRKLIDKDTEVVIANNGYSEFVFEGKSGDLSLDMPNHGDEEYVTYADLRKLKSFLKDFQLLIVAVNDEEATLTDVIKGIRLDKEYSEYFDLVLGMDFDEEIDGLDANQLEDAILDSSVDEFKEMLNSSMHRQVIITSVQLYKEGELNDYDKMSLIAKTRPEKDRENFWNDIKASLDE